MKLLYNDQTPTQNGKKKFSCDLPLRDNHRLLEGVVKEGGGILEQQNNLGI